MTHLQGVTLAGEYGLEECLGTDSSGALYRTTFGPERKPALLKLVRPEPSMAAEQLALWKRTARLSHPNILTLLDCGRADSYLYAVFEFPDDSLQGAGRLEEADARPVLDAGTSALRYLHSEGLAHGQIDAGHIVAVGNQIKLTSDALVPNGNYAEDMRAIGVLVYELVTGAQVAPGANPDLNLLPKTMRPAIRDLCMRNGAQTLRPGRWFSIASAAAAGIGLLLVVTHHSETSDRPEPAAPVKQVSAPAPKTEAVKPAAVKPAAAKPAAPAAVSLPVPPSQPVPKPSPLSPAASGSAERAASPSAIWRVVAFTYNRYQDAEKKARALNSKWDGLNAEVFSPRGKNPPYFVALGGRMTRTEAELVKSRAVGRGLPRDTFVRNFSN
jgi:hypothetical protein